MGLGEFFKYTLTPWQSEDEKKWRRQESQRKILEQRADNSIRNAATQNSRQNLSPNISRPGTQQQEPQQTPLPEVSARFDVPKYNSLFERFGDAFEANSPQDQAKRLQQGQPRLYQDQPKSGIRVTFNPANPESNLGKLVNFQATNPVAQIGKNFLQDTARSPAVIGTTIGNTIGKALNPDSKEIRFKTKDNAILRTIFGDEEIGGVTSEGQRANIPGFRSGKPAAFLGATFALLDALPGGGKAGKSVAKLSKVLSEADDVADVVEALKAINKTKVPVTVADDVLQDVSKAIAAEKDASKIEKILKDATKASKGKPFSVIDDATEQLAKDAAKAGKDAPVGVVDDVIEAGAKQADTAQDVARTTENINEELVRAANDGDVNRVNQLIQEIQQPTRQTVNVGEAVAKTTPEVTDTAKTTSVIDDLAPQSTEEIAQKVVNGEINVEDINNLYAGKAASDVTQVVDDVNPAVATPPPAETPQPIIRPTQAEAPIISTAGDAPVQTQALDVNILNELPKTVGDKVRNNIPLTPQDIEVVNRVTERAGRASTPVLPGQQSLQLGDAQIKQTVPVGIFQDPATRTTKAGNTKSIAKGDAALSQGTAKVIAEYVSDKPSVQTRLLGKVSLGGKPMSTKKARGLVANINTITRKNPELGAKLEEAIFRPLMEFNAEGAKVKEALREQVKAVKNEVRLSKKDYGVLREVMEGNADSLSKAKNPEGVRRMADEMRKVYDQALDILNQNERMAGKPLTPKRQDYFPHIQELLGEEKFLAPTKQADPDFIRRLGAGFGFRKQRSGNLRRIKEDPLEVMDIYLNAVQGQIGSLVPSRNISMYMDAVGEIGLADRRAASELTGWLKGINDDITGANVGAGVVEKVQGRVAAATVLGNVSSTLNNFIQPTLLAGIHPISSSKALFNTFGSMISDLSKGNLDSMLKIDGMESAYLRNARDAIDLGKLAKKNPVEKTGDALARIFYSTDMFSKKQVLEGFYAAERASGLSPADALRSAELKADGFLPSRTPGTLAPAFRETTLGRAASLFQTEVMAQAESIIEATRRSGALNKGGIPQGALNAVGLAIAGNLFNRGFEQLFPGRGPAPDPIGWAFDAIEKANESGENGEADVMAGFSEFFGQAASQVPVVGSYFSGFSRSPLSVPIISFGEDIGSSVQDIVTGNIDEQTITRAGRNLSRLGGRGANPVYRAGEGIYDFIKGGTKGFEVDQNPANLIRAIAGGAYNTPEAKQFFDNIGDRKDLIGQFSEQTQIDYENTNGRFADGTKYKSVIDEGAKFIQFFQNEELFDMSNAVSAFDKSRGEKIDPIFDADWFKQNGLTFGKGEEGNYTDQRTAVAYLAAKSTGNDRASKAMEIQNPWLEKLNDARSKFFDEITGTGGNKKMDEKYFGPSQGRPELSDTTQSKLDAWGDITDGKQSFEYLQANPDAAEALDQLGEWTRRKREYLGLPQYDKYPEPSASVAKAEDEYYALPEGDGPKGGNKSRREYLESHPELIQHWMEKNIYNIQQEGSLSIYEGIDLSQKALGAIKNLGRNITKLDNGSYVLNVEGDGFGGSGGRGGSGSDSSKITTVPTLSNRFGKDSINAPQVKIRTAAGKKVKVKFPSSAKKQSSVKIKL